MNHPEMTFREFHVINAISFGLATLAGVAPALLLNRFAHVAFPVALPAGVVLCWLLLFPLARVAQRQRGRRIPFALFAAGMIVAGVVWVAIWTLLA